MAGNAGVAEAWTVSEATRYIKQLLEDDPHLPEIWIRGELSDFKQHTRGHMYFTIKDEGSRMQAVMFAGYNRFLRFKPENGMNVLIRGEINVYEPYGQYQFYAKEMQPDGIGSLFAEYERLKKALEAEGLFAEERKRPIPRFPTHIAIITSPTGAVIRDMMTTLKRRYPQIRVTLFLYLSKEKGRPFPSAARWNRQAWPIYLMSSLSPGAVARLKSCGLSTKKWWLGRLQKPLFLSFRLSAMKQTLRSAILQLTDGLPLLRRQQNLQCLMPVN